jgi:hypothetical protein
VKSGSPPIPDIRRRGTTFSALAQADQSQAVGIIDWHISAVGKDRKMVEGNLREASKVV